jgi:flagellar hook-basal body complex protein FliE
VHQVVIALREAELTMQLAVEVRNKILEAYQELARTPV